MKQNKRLILFVPGFKGSTLVDKNGTTIWPDFFRAQINHYESLALSLPGQKYSCPYIAEDAVKSVRIIPGFFRYNVYGKFLHALEKNLPPFAKLLVFHYDWRQDLTETAQKLKMMIENIPENQRQTIDIVCHSMGGLLINYLMQELQIDTIRRIFFVAAPFQGSLNALLDLMHGSRLGLNKTLFSAKTMASFPGIYHLLPRYPEALENHDLFDIETWKKFRIGYLAQNANTEKLKFLETMLKNANLFYRKLELKERISCENTRIFFLNAVEHSTPLTIQFEAQERITYGRGDGGIPEISLQPPEYFKKFQCKTEHFEEKSHALILTSERVISKILREMFRE